MQVFLIYYNKYLNSCYRVFPQTVLDSLKCRNLTDICSVPASISIHLSVSVSRNTYLVLAYQLVLTAALFVII